MNPFVIKLKNILTRQLVSPEISRQQVQKLTPQFVFFIYILDIDSHCPYLLLFFYKTKKYLVFYSHNLFFLEMLD